MGRYARYFDPQGVSDLAFSILRSAGQRPRGKGVSLTDLCVLLDWMHENIAYELDSDQYGRQEDIATPQETLRSKRGDCEDHALLIGSMCLALGAKVRFALVPGHAFSEICLGPSSDFDGKAAVKEIRRYIDTRSRSFGLSFGEVPFSQGKLASGWSRNSAGDYTRNPRRWSTYSRKFHRVQWNIIDGEIYMPVDDCYCMMYPGDVARMTEFMGSGSGGLWREVDYELALPEKAATKAAPPEASRERPVRVSPRPSRRPSAPRTRNGRRYLGALVTIMASLLIAGHIGGELPIALDAAVGCLALWSAWRGYQLGFFEQGIALMAWVLPVVLSLWLLNWADGLYLEYVDVALPYRKALIVLLLFGVSAALMRALVKSVADGRRSSAVDGLLGSVFGVAMAVVMVALALPFASRTAAEFGWEPELNDSIMASYAKAYDPLNSEIVIQAKDAVSGLELMSHDAQ